MLVWAVDGISDSARQILADAGHEVTDAFCSSRPVALWTRAMFSGPCEYWQPCKTATPIIACPATGTEHLDKARTAGIKVLSLRDCGDLSSIRATVEFTIGAIVSLTRRIPSAVESVRRGDWDRMRWQGMDLSGKTVGIVGCGRIGSSVATILHSLGMVRMRYDPQCGSRPSAFMALLEAADLVTVHADLNDTSRGMFGPAEFAAMKPGAYFVNTARGQIIDEAALLDALKSGHLAGAALDVLCQEPPPADSPLLAFAREQPERLILTPHLGGCTVESLERAETLLAHRLVEELAKDELKRTTPSNDELLRMAKRNPPPQSWYEEDDAG